MKAVRLAAAALLSLCVLGLSCTTHEAALEAARTSLQTQIADRERILAGNQDLDRFEARLTDWKKHLRDGLRLPRPRVEISLDPSDLAPLEVPPLPPKASLESARSAALREEIARLFEKARALDRDLSAFEQRKEHILLREKDAHFLDDWSAEAPLPPFLAAVRQDGGARIRDAGMRRLPE